MSEEACGEQAASPMPPVAASVGAQAPHVLLGVPHFLSAAAGRGILLPRAKVSSFQPESLSPHLPVTLPSLFRQHTVIVN